MSAEEKTTDICVVDKALWHTSNFPLNDDSGMAKQAQFYRHLYNCPPNPKQFECLAKDDGDRLVCGPFAVRGNPLLRNTTTKDIAKFQFFNKCLRYPYDAETKALFDRHQPSSLGKRETYYIASAQHLEDPNVLRETRRDAHRHDAKLYLNQFTAIVPRSKVDLCVCVHKVPLSLPQKDMIPYAIQDHVKECLGRKEGCAGAEQPPEENYYVRCSKWNEAVRNKKRSDFPTEFWMQNHPHWSHFKYRASDGFIAIDPIEMAQLSEQQQYWATQLENGTLSSEERDAARPKLMEIIMRMVEDYEACKYDINGFSLVRECTIHELLKMIAFPPIPRARQENAEPNVTLQHMQMAMTFRQNMRLVCNVEASSSDEDKKRGASGETKSKSGRGGGSAVRGGGRGGASTRGGRGAGATKSGGRGKGKASTTTTTTTSKKLPSNAITLLTLAAIDPIKAFMTKHVEKAIMSGDGAFYIVTEPQHIARFLNWLSALLLVPIDSLLKTFDPQCIGEEAFSRLAPQSVWQFEKTGGGGGNG